MKYQQFRASVFDVWQGSYFMRLTFLFVFTICIPSSLWANPPSDTVKDWRVRVIHTTDMGADPDDQQSLVRQLVMANDVQIEGLITSTGCWRKTQQDTRYVNYILDAYTSVYSNLTAHASGFPTPEYLKSHTVLGQSGYGMNDVGPGKDSAGSELIIQAVDRNDERPLWVTCWGGCNTIAQALWKARETRSESELKKFVAKLRIYDVLGQDNAGAWIAKTFPTILYIRAIAVYSWQPDDLYLQTHVQNHGPLGRAYPDRKWATEGDTPAFMHLQNPGLNDPEKVDQGGWGGRFELTKQRGVRGMECMKGEEKEFDPYYMYSDSPEAGNAIKRWENAYNNDFQARMDWTLSSEYSEANHHPHAKVNGDNSKKIKYLDVSAGSLVKLSAEGSTDPDGDKLRFEWQYYGQASDYQKAVNIVNADKVNSTVLVPLDAKGQTIHIVLLVNDLGIPSLTTYRRVVLRVK